MASAARLGDGERRAWVSREIPSAGRDRLPLVEVLLEDESGGGLVEEHLPVAWFHPGLREPLAGGDGSEPLVARDDRHPEPGAEALDEGHHLLALRAERAVQAQGEADHDLAHAVLAHESGDRLGVLPPAHRPEGHEARRERPRLVGQGHPDPHRTHVEGQDAHAASIASGSLALTPPRASAILRETPGGFALPEPKYRILHQLGAGGMGTVRKGLLLGQAGFQRPIVVKQLRNPDPEHLRLFVDEARRYAVLDHENIGRIFDFERVDGELCIILEYIDGWSLVEYLERHRALGCLPDVELSVFIASRVCRGLQYVFEKARIVHRDVSPSNVMMTTEGTVKLIDFGIAARSGTRETYLAGKPSYMAPEMVVEMRADQRSDVFAVGTILFEILTGERLFAADTTPEVLERVVAGDIPKAASLNPGVPGAVEAILARALERNPARRFVSAAAMGEACEHFLYDKGYGPTNLTLKHYLASIFGRGLDNEAAEEARSHEPTLIPLRDEMRRGEEGEPTRVVSPLKKVVVRAKTPRPGGLRTPKDPRTPRSRK